MPIEFIIRLLMAGLIVVVAYVLFFNFVIVPSRKKDTSEMVKEFEAQQPPVHERAHELKHKEQGSKTADKSKAEKPLDMDTQD